MNISQIDALFNALLASPARTPEDLVKFIYTQYRDYCEAAARSIIKKNYPGMYDFQLVAETAAEQVIESQVRKALDGSFSFQGKARYSTFLYSALERQVSRAQRKTLIAIEPRLARRIRLESAPREVYEASESERAGDPALAQVYRSALLEGLNECLAKLEPHEAKLATYVYVRGLTPTEACRRLGLRSPSYTWKLLQDKLRPLLERHDLPSLYAGYRELRE